MQDIPLTNVVILYWAFGHYINKGTLFSKKKVLGLFIMKWKYGCIGYGCWISLLCTAEDGIKTGIVTKGKRKPPRIQFLCFL